MGKSQESVRSRRRTTYKKPPMFKVLVHNDDFTTFEFVASVMQQVFHMDAEAALSFAIEVDRVGKAVAGVYPYDIAITKVDEAMSLARNVGFPLTLTCEEE